MDEVHDAVVAAAARLSAAVSPRLRRGRPARAAPEPPPEPELQRLTETVLDRVPELAGRISALAHRLQRPRPPPPPAAAAAAAPPRKRRRTRPEPASDVGGLGSADVWLLALAGLTPLETCRFALTCRFAREVAEAAPHWRELHLSFDRRHKPAEAAVRALATRHAATLVRVDLCDSRLVGDAGVAALAACAQLRELALAGCVRVSPAALTPVTAACPLLRALDLSGCPRMGAGLAAPLGSAHALESLALNRCSTQLGDEVLRAVAHACPRLRTLSLSNSRRVTDVGVARLDTLTELRALTVAHCEAVVSGVAVCFVAHRSPGLQLLSLRGTRCALSVLHRVAARCAALRVLDLAGSPVGGSGALVDVVARQPQLEQLLVSDVAAVTDATLLELAEHCPLLRVLEANFCARVTDRGVAAVAAGCPRLRVLALQGAPVAAAALRAADELRVLNVAATRVRDAEVAGLAARLGVVDLVCARGAVAGLTAAAPRLRRVNGRALGRGTAAVAATRGCSFGAGGARMRPAAMYACETCLLQHGAGCCAHCARTCHAGHDVRLVAHVQKFYCDCGWAGCRG